MTPQGDTKRPRSVKLEIDPDFCGVHDMKMGLC
jgi:hypothetical protein